MAAFRDMEEVSQGLLSLLGANRAEAQQRRLLGRHEQVVERLLETQDSVEQRLQEILAAEQEVAQSLLDAKEQAHQGGAELQQLEAELQKAGEEDSRLKARLLQLTRELEELKETEASLERQEREVDEDTTVTIPSAVYVAQLYRQISKIEWDYECEPGMVKGSILLQRKRSPVRCPWPCRVLGRCGKVWRVLRNEAQDHHMTQQSRFRAVHLCV
uniref:Kinetochore protein Spc24 n=1 Tax=Suricata suricatta TaxID=37032 RepID=A0A673VGB7_SURSU